MAEMHLGNQNKFLGNSSLSRVFSLRRFKIKDGLRVMFDMMEERMLLEYTDAEDTVSGVGAMVEDAGAQEGMAGEEVAVVMDEEEAEVMENLLGLERVGGTEIDLEYA